MSKSVSIGCRDEWIAKTLIHLGNSTYCNTKQSFDTFAILIRSFVNN